jgi:hypothetical protein
MYDFLSFGAKTVPLTQNQDLEQWQTFSHVKAATGKPE